MNKHSHQEIISALNNDGIGSQASTFLYLLGYGTNKIQKSRKDLAADLELKPRTLRSHLIRLRKAGYIDDQVQYDSPNIITIKKFAHDGQTD